MCNKMRAYVQRECALAYLDEPRARLSGRASRSLILTSLAPTPWTSTSQTPRSLSRGAYHWTSTSSLLVQSL